MGCSVVLLGDQLPMPSQQGLRCDNAGDLGKSLSSQRFGLNGQPPALMVIEAHSWPPSCSRSTRFSSRRYSMTSSWRWFIHPETAISKNWNGSSTLCIFKTHYRVRRTAVAEHRIFMQIQFSDHTG